MHDCPDCGLACYCDSDDCLHDPPNNCCHECDDFTSDEDQGDHAGMCLEFGSRGGPECDGTCAPMCDWCLVAHSCPTDCTEQGLECPYEGMKRGSQS